jgi:hypothetical protein
LVFFGREGISVKVLVLGASFSIKIRLLWSEL